MMRPLPLRPTPPRPPLPLRALALVAALALAAAGVAFADVAAGDRLTDAGDFRGAAAEYARAAERDPDDAEALARLARATTYLAEEAEGTDGDAAEALYEEAAEHARAAVAVDPDYAEGHFEVARALGRLAQFTGVLESLNLADEVEERLERTLELDPEHAGAMHALALWHVNVPWIAGGRRGRVRPLFERAIELEPDAVTHRVDYAEVLIGFDEPEAARAQLEAALDLPARTWHDERDHDRARAMLDSL